ncbi:hypothetical protein MCOR34_003160 [Pyricularia oryzae]|uniref:DSC E3 ubiquitin ligase complex subunit A n=1 Tax=Pyricularia oryzae TaxID=318829 RepID=A0A4P7N615_PYROR|nr:hypothetical protein MCOR34_003160 [Pyricularia oryzae]KAI6454899.1 hypothetical protein MCOR17_008873 [Pyricularia oryzae]QBZ57012.1 hypothetical protein PoMZ_01931 [Pyricularia oryzae]
MAQPQDQARFVMLIVLLLWLTSTPDSGPGIMSAPSIIAARLGRQRVAHSVLNNTQWGEFAPPPPNQDPDRPAPSIPNNGTGYLNITGFREEDKFAWRDLDLFRQRCLEWSHNAYRGIGQHGEKESDRWGLAEGWPTWHNATGIVHGSWVRADAIEQRSSSSYNLTQLAPTIPWAISEFGRNITGKEGKILLRLDDKQRGTELPDLEVEESTEEGQERKPLVKTGGIIREVSAMASIEDVTGSGSTHHVVLHGVHWPRQGAMLLTTTSDKFAGIFGLPHLTPSLNFFRTSQKLLNETIGEVLRRKEKARFSEVTSNPWGSYPNMPQDSWNPFPHCEYVMYIQVHPLGTQQLGEGLLGDKANERLDDLIGRIEDELRFPSGAPLPRRVPDLQMSAVVYSPDCAYFLQTKGPPAFAPADGRHLVGLKEEVYTYSTKLYLLAFAGLMFAQVQLLKMQMRESSTPSTIARVSFWTTSMMVVVDGIVFGASSFLSLSDSATLLPSLLLTYAGFISMTIGGSFLYEVYKVQEPERRTREREQPQQTSAATSPQEAAALAATARAAATSAPPPPRPQTPPIIIPSDQDIDLEIETHPDAPNILPITNPAAATIATPTTSPAPDQPAPFSTILGRYVLFGVVLLLLSIAATTWWARAREIYVNGLVFCYLSLWVPQIIRNVTRNSRRAFSWRFMVGQSVLRLIPIAYFYLRERNIAFSKPDRETFVMLAGWLWCQLWVLGFQDIFGPRFGVPKGWAPEAWDYHPILREDSVEAGGLPIGLLGSGEPGSPSAGQQRFSSGGDAKNDIDKHTRLHSIDCAICREVLEVPVIRAGQSDPAGAGGVAGVFARRQYMVTPCRHIFHSECLEGWLRFRLQCPICRENLPPL